MHSRPSVRAGIEGVHWGLRVSDSLAPAAPERICSHGILAHVAADLTVAPLAVLLLT